TSHGGVSAFRFFAKLKFRQLEFCGRELGWIEGELCPAGRRRDLRRTQLGFVASSFQEIFEWHPALLLVSSAAIVLGRADIHSIYRMNLPGSGAFRRSA